MSSPPGPQHGTTAARKPSASSASWSRVLLWPLLVASGWYLFAITLFTSILVNALQFAVYALLLPFRNLQLRVLQALANIWWDMFVFSVEVWCLVEVTWYGDHLTRDHCGLLLGNHSAANMDFIPGIIVANRGGVGAGRMMVLMKKSIKCIPMIGWTHWLQGSLFLSRSWQTDSRQLTRKMDEMNQVYPRPFWVGLFPEGTRQTPKKLAESQRYARENGLPVYQHVLLPRTKGFHFIVENLRPSLQHIYDVTISYEGLPRLTKFLFRGDLGTRRIHLYVRQVPIEEVPKGITSATDGNSAGTTPKHSGNGSSGDSNTGAVASTSSINEHDPLNLWLLDSFSRKDVALSYYKQHGKFDAVQYSNPPNVWWITGSFVLLANVFMALVGHLAFGATGTLPAWFMVLFVVHSASVLRAVVNAAYLSGKAAAKRD